MGLTYQENRGRTTEDKTAEAVAFTCGSLCLVFHLRLKNDSSRILPDV